MKRIFVIAVCLVASSGLFAQLVQAQSAPTQQSVFESDDVRDYGGMMYDFRVADLGTVEQAELVFDDVVDDYIEVFTGLYSKDGDVISIRTALVPNVGDESRGFAGFVDVGGIVERGVIFVREGQYVYAFFVIGIHGAYLELSELTMYYFLVAERQQGQLPTIDMMPAGFSVTDAQTA